MFEDLFGLDMPEGVIYENPDAVSRKTRIGLRQQDTVQSFKSGLQRAPAVIPTGHVHPHSAYDGHTHGSVDDRVPEGHYKPDAIAESGRFKTGIGTVTNYSSNSRVINGFFNTATNNILAVSPQGTSNIQGRWQHNPDGKMDSLILDENTVFQPIIVYPKGGANVPMGYTDIVSRPDGTKALYAATGEWFLEGEDKENFSENVGQALKSLGIGSRPVQTINSDFTVDQWRDTTTHGRDRALNATHFSGEPGAFARQDGVIPIYFVRGLGGYAAGQGYTEPDGTTVQYAMMGDIAIEGVANIGDQDNYSAGQIIFSGEKEAGGQGRSWEAATSWASAGHKMGTVMHEADHALGMAHDFQSDDIIANKVMSGYGNVGIEMFGVDGDKRERAVRTMRSERVRRGEPEVSRLI